MKNKRQKEQDKLERKYSKVIDKMLKKYKDKTMAELWVACDAVKIKMKTEMDKLDEVYGDCVD